jgi:hypothetical protein
MMWSVLMIIDRFLGDPSEKALFERRTLFTSSYWIPLRSVTTVETITGSGFGSVMGTGPVATGAMFAGDGVGESDT